MHVDLLKRNPEHVETVARWIYDEWDHVNVPDLEAERELVRARLNEDRVPMTLIALDGEECVGTVSLYESDLASRPDLTPWLAALYVREDRRNTGIGSALVERIVEAARRIGIRRLYLHTETAPRYYERKGWRLLFETINDRNEKTEVFDLMLE